ncbi:PKD domain-containing protein, partial [Streptomyces decoyicus]
KPPAPGYRYHWYFGDGTQRETGEAAVTHAYVAGRPSTGPEGLAGHRGLAPVPRRDPGGHRPPPA